MKPRHVGIASILLIVLALILLGMWGSPYLAFMLCLVYLNIILAVSLYALLRAGVFSLGHAAFMAFGAYGGFVAMHDLSMPFGAAILFGGCVAAVVAFIVGMPSLRLKTHYFAIATILFAEATRHVMSWLDGLTGGVHGMMVPTTPILFGIKFTEKNGQYFLLAIAVVAIYLFYRLLNSQYGYICQASGADEDLAASIGIRFNAYRLTMFTLTAFVAGLVGVMYGALLTFITPETFNIFISIYIFVYITVGGAISILGPVIGAVFMTFLTEPFRNIPYLASLCYGVVLLFVILFLPEGFLGGLRKLRSTAIANNFTTMAQKAWGQRLFWRNSNGGK